MIPVHQTAHDHNGNCLAACIASVLEIPIEGVPNFILEDGWRNATNRFLEKYGLFLLCVRIEAGETPEEVLPDGWMLVCGRSMKDRWHATVGRRGQVVFDPAPTPVVFIDDSREYELFVVLDPARGPLR